MPAPPINYTTTVSAVKTAGEIVEALARHGARRVATDYKDGRPVALSFVADTPHGERQFDLPVDVEGMLTLMRRRAPARYRTIEQAERVAWRVIKVWILAQLALVDTQMVGLDAVMLPWMRIGIGGRTVLDAYRADSSLPELQAP